MTVSATSSQQTAANQPATSFVDPVALMRIRSLELRAKVVMEGFFNGLHRSPFHGFSVEFSEYRQYASGDDLRYFDWRLYARSDRYYVKRFEDETNLRCHLLVDMSRSMGFGSGEYSKADYARTVAATLAYFLFRQHDAVGLMTFDQAIAQFVPARYRPGHLHRLMLTLEQPLDGTSTDLSGPLEQIADTVPKRGLIVLVSDLLAPIETLQSRLGYLRLRGHDVIVLRVLDPAERDFTFSEATTFYDVESGRQLYVDPAEARRDYLRRFGEHAAAIRQAAAGLSVDFFEMATDRPIELAVLDFVNARASRGRQASLGRRGPRSGRGRA